MAESSEQEMSTEEKSKKWNQEHYVEAMKYCDKHGLKVANFDQKNSRVLPPVLAIWKINLATQPKSTVWVIGGGKVMMDHVDVTMAETARDVLRHFSMSWQLKASQMEANLADPSSVSSNVEQQQKIIDTLISEAEALYGLYADEKAWL